jgi:AraC-like DNA-binding protein
VSGFLRLLSSIVLLNLCSGSRLHYLEQYRHAIKKEDDVDVVDAAIHYMKENIENRITLQDVITYIGYSASRFSTLFKKKTGSTPLNYFNQLKIQRSCYLLKKTDMRINQICYKIGIEDSLYFSRLFSKTMGMSPREFREKQN